MHAHVRDQDELRRQEFWSRVSLLLAAVLIVGAFLSIKNYSFFGDEGYHTNQIARFLKGDWGVNGDVTTIPGFHLLVATMSMITGEKSLGFTRFVALCMSFVGVIAALKIAEIRSPSLARIRLFQVLLLPILFPFFALLYTDGTSLSFVLLGLWAFLRKSYGWAFLALALSVLIRQNNIVWLVCFACAWLWTEHGPALMPLGRDLLRRKWTGVLSASRRIFHVPGTAKTFLFLALCAAAFLTFVKVNGGIAIGDQGSHPFPAVHLGNVFFLLALFTLLLLPLVLARIPEIFHALQAKQWLIPLMVGLFVLYMLTFWNTHWYNQDADSVFLRNRMLVFVTQTPLLKATGFAFVGAAFLTLLLTPLSSPWWLLYPATILYLLPSWLIEQRYYFVPFALFLLLRKPESRRVEWLLLGYEVIVAGILFWIVQSRWLFL